MHPNANGMKPVCMQTRKNGSNNSSPFITVHQSPAFGRTCRSRVASSYTNRWHVMLQADEKEANINYRSVSTRCLVLFSSLGISSWESLYPHSQATQTGGPQTISYQWKLAKAMTWQKRLRFWKSLDHRLPSATQTWSSKVPSIPEAPCMPYICLHWPPKTTPM